MDLKTALREILPKITLRAKHKADDKWVIDRPVEFHECYTCGDMVDQRIVDVVCITAPDEYEDYLSKSFASWCHIHNSINVQLKCKEAKPCPRCYRWSIRRGICHMCTHNLHCDAPPPMIVKRPWFVRFDK